MSFISENNPCPCESGLDYLYCCGGTGANEIRVMGDVSIDPMLIDTLPGGIRDACAELSSHPSLFPVSYNVAEGQVTWVKMSPFWYNESDFLDAARILGRSGFSSSQEWLLNQVNPCQWQETAFIFHTAFCGSTLLTKALANIYHVLPLREPDVLGTVAWQDKHQNFIERPELCALLSLLSRRFEQQDRALVKANDHSNSLINHLLSWRRVPVLFMYVSLQDFVAACVRAENRIRWIDERCQYVGEDTLGEVFPGYKQAYKEGDVASMAALYWSYNISLYLDAYNTFPDLLRSLDFELMLKAPREAVRASAQWFSLQQRRDVNFDDELSSVMSIYSKGSHEYGPNQRRKDVDAILSQNTDIVIRAESYARHLLGARYPDSHLPGKLFSPGVGEPAGNPPGLFARFFRNKR